MTENAVRARPDRGKGAPEDGEANRSKPARLPLRIWRRSVVLGREIIAAAGGLVATLGVVLVVAIIVESLVDRTITVEPLSVPKSLAEDGLSPEVVALSLRDRMGDLAGKVRRERGFSEGLDIIDPEELPDVAVPSVGLSAQALAADVRAFFKIQNRLIVSGEVVSKDGAYRLTLRLNGHAFFHSRKGLPRDGLNALVAQAARAALVATQPYVGAVLAFDERDDASAIALCDGIIAGGGAAKRVRFALVLRAQALNRTGRHEEAVAASQTLIGLDPSDAAAHINLGNIYAAQGRRDAAVAEYERAIALNKSLAPPHVRLANLYLAMGRPNDAVREAKVGVELRKVAYPHLVLGNALRGAGRDEEAVAQYRQAAALGPTQTWVRLELGEALRRSGLLDEAMEQFRAAVASDPEPTDACRALASALAEQGRGGAMPPECDAAGSSGASAASPSDDAASGARAPKGAEDR